MSLLNSTYTPSSLVDVIHGRPRFGFTDTPTNGGSTVDEEYIKGVAMNVAVLAAVGVLFSLATYIMYVCACCRRKCGCYKVALSVWEDPLPSHRRTTVLRTFLVLLVIGCGALGFGVHTATNGIDDVASASDQAGELTDTLTVSINQLNNRVDASQVIVARLLANPDAAAYTSALVSIDDALQQTEEDTSVVLDKSTEAKSDSRRFSNDARDVSGQAWDVGMLVGLVYVVWAVLMLASITYDWASCSWMFKGFTLVGLLFLLILSWLLAAGAFTAVFAVGDTCYDPETTALDLASSVPPFAPNDTSLEATMYYYMRCGVENAFLPRVGLILTLDDVRVRVDASATQVDSLPASADTDVNADIQALKSSVAAQVETIGVALSIGECESVQNVWDTARDGACGDGVNGLVAVFAGLVLIWMSTTFALMAGTRFWIRHPKKKAASVSAPGHLNSRDAPLPMVVDLEDPTGGTSGAAAATDPAPPTTIVSAPPTTIASAPPIATASAPPQGPSNGDYDPKRGEVEMTTRTSTPPPPSAPAAHEYPVHYVSPSTPTHASTSATAAAAATAPPLLSATVHPTAGITSHNGNNSPVHPYTPSNWPSPSPSPSPSPLAPTHSGPTPRHPLYPSMS